MQKIDSLPADRYIAYEGQDNTSVIRLFPLRQSTPLRARFWRSSPGTYNVRGSCIIKTAPRLVSNSH